MIRTTKVDIPLTAHQILKQVCKQKKIKMCDFVEDAVMEKIGKLEVHLVGGSK